MKKMVMSISIISLLLLLSTVGLAQNRQNEDFDPLTDIEVTVDIIAIRSLQKTDLGISSLDKIDLFSDPDFYIKIFINDEVFISETWENTKYIYNTPFSATLNVPDDEEIVDIKIQLWDKNPSGDTLCDISNNYGSYEENFDIDLQYSIKAGHWNGDDYINHDIGWFYPDPSGYGRTNGCDDGSVYQNNKDCELWFNIYQNDFDGDTIPYWTEINVFGTNPEKDNTGEDLDKDGVPIEWEYKWGHFMYESWSNDDINHYWFFDPFTWEDHETLDDDNDGLSNYEEFLTSQWDSDPFRKDLFVELDQMKAGPNGEPASLLPIESKEMLRTAYNKQNIVYHLDDGSWEETGSEMIPFDKETKMNWGNGIKSELDIIYEDYFLHDDENNWRRGVFHYGVLVYQCSVANGNAFGNNRFQISYKGLSEKNSIPWLDKDIVFASAYMHECGHTLGIINPGVDDQNSKYPWQLNWWKWLPYKSVMNYGYMFRMVDYSDGSRGMNDFDDWSDLDLTYFDNPDW